MPARSLDPESSWIAMIQSAKAAKRESKIFTSRTRKQRYSVLEIEPDSKYIRFTRIDADKPSRLYKGEAVSAIQRLNENNGIRNRREFHSTVAKESAMVFLHPRLGYSSDDKDVIITARSSKFNEDEIACCTYAAGYGSEDIGGLENIVKITGRELGSIKMKVNNIVSMLDEIGFSRSSPYSPLTGLPTGERGRRTNFEWVKIFITMSQSELLDYCLSVIGETISEPGEISGPEILLEGSVKTVKVNKYERNPRARKLCIEHYGAICSVCDMDFKQTYGEIGEGFIHVHHIVPLHEIGKGYEVNPVDDLIPVCPNCHSMIHKRKPAFSITELKEILEQNQFKG